VDAGNGPDFSGLGIDFLAKRRQQIRAAGEKGQAIPLGSQAPGQRCADSTGSPDNDRPSGWLM
jgi:hypothetical protein